MYLQPAVFISLSNPVSRACGKSSLTIRLTDDRFSQVHDVTIAAEIGSKIVEVGENHEHMKLQIWDTAGQEHFRAVTRSYFRNAAGCLLVYDVTRRTTFLHAKEWLDDIRSQADDDIAICLVGNKVDMVEDDESDQSASRNGDGSGSSSLGNINNTGSRSDTSPSKKRSAPSQPKAKRQVSFEEAQKWARENNIFTFVETSAKDGCNVLEAYMRVSNEIHRKITSGQYDLNDRSHGIKAAGGKRGAGGMVKLSMDAAQDRSRKKNTSESSSCC